MNVEDVNIEELRDKPIYAAHIWNSRRGRQEVNCVKRPAKELGIYKLGRLMEHQTLFWVRRSIFRKGVLFSSDVIFLS